EEAYDRLSNILEDSKWSVCEYKNWQQTWVILVSQDSNQLYNFSMQPKIEIYWKYRQIKDETNYISEAGYMSLSFVIDQIYF
ncbi:32291_t:CDS:1, partial [Racocetra persica]